MIRRGTGAGTGRAVLLGAALMLVGCSGRVLPTNAPAKGNLLSLAAKHSERSARRIRGHAPRPAVVLVERRGLRAIDPISAVELWSVSAAVSGHATATDAVVFVPLHGHRLLAVDRLTGEPLWKVAMPGEALTGLAAAGPVVVLTVIDRERGRSRAVGLSAIDGQTRWVRRSSDRFGAPAAVGGVAVVPLGDQVIGLRLRTGREVARLNLPKRSGARPAGAPSLERVEVQGHTLVAGQGSQWVDLSMALASTISEIEKLQGALGQVASGTGNPGAKSLGQVLPDEEGLDPGFGDRERLRLWVDVVDAKAGARSAFLMCRRGVLAFRLDAQGQPSDARWGYLNRDEREFVGMHVTDERVTLVLEDGELLTLGRRDGAELDRISGDEPTTGALFLDVTDGFGKPSLTRPTKAYRLQMLAEIVLDPDPRLLPAQLMVADLLWRDEEPRVRDAVGQLATAQVRGEPTAAAAALRKHALDLISSPWGRQAKDEAASMLAELAERPSFLDDIQPPIGMLARAAMAAGDQTMVPHLVGHLLHPATASSDLVELVRALDKLGRPDAVQGIAAFVRRYHADASAVDESEALAMGVQVLLRHARVDDPANTELAARMAREALSDLLDDPFTEASLRTQIDRNLPLALRSGLEILDEDEGPTTEDESHEAPAIEVSQR